MVLSFNFQGENVHFVPPADFVTNARFDGVK